MIHTAYVPAAGCDDLDPRHRSMPVVGAAANPYLAHTMWKTVLPISRSVGFDERPVELGILETRRVCPVGAGGWFVIRCNAHLFDHRCLCWLQCSNLFPSVRMRFT